MKLNVGCGYDRLEGYINLDSNPDSAADKLMPAHDLAFASGSVSEIRALHLIEHLGFFRAKYFLSECWRVLEPGGALLVETPDIEKTFELFLAGDHKVKEAALGWVYGSEMPGMGHLYCFPRDLLAELFAEAGFDVTKTEEFLFQPRRPALRFEAVKKAGERPALNAALRRRLLDGGQAVFNNELVSAGIELVVRRLTEGGGNSALELEQALYSAPATLEYFILAGENEQHQSREAAACARLCSWNVQGRLAAVFAAGSAGGLDAAAAFEAALSAGRLMLAAALSGNPAAPGPEPAPGAPPVFTPQTAQAWEFKRKFRICG